MAKSGEQRFGYGIFNKLPQVSVYHIKFYLRSIFILIISPVMGRNQRFLHLTFVSAHIRLFSASSPLVIESTEGKGVQWTRRLLREGPFPATPPLKRSVGSFCVRLQILALPHRQVILQMSAECRNLVAHHLDFLCNKKKDVQS